MVLIKNFGLKLSIFLAKQFNGIQRIRSGCLQTNYLSRVLQNVEAVTLVLSQDTVT